MLNETAITVIVSVVGTLSATWLGWSTKAKEQRKEVQDEAKSDAAIKMDIQYIKRGVDDVRLEIRSQGQEVKMIAERVTRVEESSKQAHKRIDRIEEVKGG